MIVLEIFKVLYRSYDLIWSCVFLGIVFIIGFVLLVLTEEKLERQGAENEIDSNISMQK